MGKFKELAKQLDWFEGTGVDRWNFCVLRPPAGDGRGTMIGHDRARDRDEVLRSAGWAWAKNARENMNVYMRPARGGDWSVILLDDVSRTALDDLKNRYKAFSVETSAGSFQIWIALSRPLSEPDRYAVQKAAAAVHGGDPRSVSGEHFGRAAGYRNRKPGRDGFSVRIIAGSGTELLNPDALLNASTHEARPALARRCDHRCQREWDGSESRREWAWACGYLKNGGRPDVAMQRLAVRAAGRGKRGDVHRYARMTIERAVAAVAAGRV